MKKRNVGIVFSYASTILNMVCGLFLSSFLLRMLGDTEYGLYQTVSSFSTYLVLLEFGIGTVMTRNILVQRNSGQEDKIKYTVSTLSIFAVALCLLIAVISTVACLNIGVIYKNTMTPEQIPYAQQVFAVMTVYLIASFLKQAISGILLGMENYTYARIVDIVQISCRTLLLAFLISRRPYAIIIALVDSGIGIACFAVTFIFIKAKYRIPMHWKYFDKQILKASMPLCVAMLLQTFVNQANNSVGKFLIGVMVSMESVAVYSVAQYIYNMFSSFTTIPITMYMPQVAKSIADGLEGKSLTQTLVKPCRLVVLIGGLVCGGFFAVGKPFVAFVYDMDPLNVWTYALLLMLPMFINMTSGIVINVLDVKNKRMVRSWVLVGTTVLNVIMTVFGLPRFGIISAVFSTAISTLIGQVFIMNIYYARGLGLKILYLYKEAYKGLLEYIILGAAAGYLISEQISNSILAFLCGGAVMVVISFAGIIIHQTVAKRIQKQ